MILVSGSHSYWKIILERVLFVFVFSQTGLARGGPIKRIRYHLFLSLPATLCSFLPSSLWPHLSLPAPFLSLVPQVSVLPLPPLAPSFLFPSSAGMWTERAVLAFLGLSARKWNRSNYKNDLERMLFGKMGKQLFRGGFAVSRRLLPAATPSFAGLLDVTLLARAPLGLFSCQICVYSYRCLVLLSR